MSPMCQQKLRREPVPGIPQQDTHKDLPTAWPTTAPQKAATAWEGPQKEAETIRRCLHLSPYPKAAAASPRAPSGPGWWLLGGQELVRRPGRARDVGWHQPPQCPLRNWWAQPERSGMSQLPCQGQQEMTSAAPGLVPSLALPEVPPTSGVSGSSLEFSLPRHSPEGDLRKRIQGPAPPTLPQLAAAHWARVCGAEVSCSELWPRVRPGPGSRPNPRLPCISPSVCPEAAQRVEGAPRLCDPVEASALSGNREGKSSVSSDMGNTQCLVHGASEMGWEAGEGSRK